MLPVRSLVRAQRISSNHALLGRVNFVYAPDLFMDRDIRYCTRSHGWRCAYGHGCSVLHKEPRMAVRLWVGILGIAKGPRMVIPPLLHDTLLP